VQQQQHPASLRLGHSTLQLRLTPGELHAMPTLAQLCPSPNPALQAARGNWQAAAGKRIDKLTADSEQHQLERLVDQPPPHN
jgi:hypothetical protein